MRCKKVRRLINSSDVTRFKSQITEHLNRCKSCARVFESQKIVKQLLSEARTQPTHESTPISDLYLRIEKLSSGTQRKEALMSRIMNAAKKKPQLITAFGLALTALIVFTAIPFSSSKTIGYDLVYNDLPDTEKIQTKPLEIALSAYGYDNISMSASNSSFLISNLPTKQAVQEAKDIYGAFVGNDGKPVVREKKQKTAETLYAQAKGNKKNDNQYRISLEFKNKTDVEIEREIREKLKAEGIDSINVRIRTGENGQRYLTVDFSEEDGGYESSFSIVWQGGDTINLDLGEGLEDIYIESQGKSPEEIKQEIIMELRKKGHPEPEVIIKTNEKGEIIEINVEKEKDVQGDEI